MTELVWDGCVNVRDVGGLVRADNIRFLSDEGWQALVDHGVRRVVDLRFAHELAEDVPREAPVEVVHISLLGDERNEEWEAGYDALMDSTPTAEEYLVSVYTIFLERHRDRFARVFEAIADAPPGPVVVHCFGGKDRTGLVVALALRLVGESLDEVAADYARTELNLAQRHARWVSEAEDETERRRRTLLGPAPAAAMRRVIEQLESQHGSVEAYLRGGGLSDAAIVSVRKRLQD
ncbi:MAG TPA: tyrosine-protein phosphatase [Gaiellaceae bacterium]|nr:tyrosine-protein phosphatase [Gaiellaceae bacterium]